MFLQIFRVTVLLFFSSLFAVNPAKVPPTVVINAPRTYEIGEHAKGGVIFWLTPDKEHGLVSAIVDQDGGSGVVWAPSGFFFTQIGAYINGIIFGENYTTTAGSVNTQRITSIIGSGTYAANNCSNYSVTVDGITYDDWYLPSAIELAMMYIRASIINTTATANGGTAFASATYWSSLEASSSSGSCQSFATGFQFTATKSTLERVRAIRAF